MKRIKSKVALHWDGKNDSVEYDHKGPIETVELSFEVMETFDKGDDTVQCWSKKGLKDWKNLLIWGDNKAVMSALLTRGWKERFQLIYIDPPFFTGTDFTVKKKIGKKKIGTTLPLVETRTYNDSWLGGLASYLQYMHERLVLVRALLAETGTLYVHLDWRVGHYVKVMLDEIFGYHNFMNQIVWRKTNSPKAQSRGLGTQHDMIFVYAKNINSVLFHKIYRSHDEKTLRPYRYEDERGRFRLIELEAQGIQRTKKRKTFEFKGRIAPWLYSKEKLEQWWSEGLIYKTKNGRYAKKQYLDDVPGVLLSDIWIDDEVAPLQGNSNEYLWFTTQKPESLLKRIILASSDSGDVIGDFFCGSGTTLAVAEKLGRRWVGCDLSRSAIHVTRKRLLGIHESRDLLSSNRKKRKSCYGKSTRPFEIWRVDGQLKEFWRLAGNDPRDLILELYQATPLENYKFLHGEKNGRVIHVGSLSLPVTLQEIKLMLQECKAANYQKIDVLGFEWDQEVFKLKKDLEISNDVDLRFIQVPSGNEMCSVLIGEDLTSLTLSNQSFRKKLFKHVRFYELPSLQVEVKVKGRTVTVTLVSYQVSRVDEEAEIAEKVTDSLEFVDYWSIDWNYNGKVFHDQWHSFKTKKQVKVDNMAFHEYQDPGIYIIMLKVIDVFGAEIRKMVKITIE